MASVVALPALGKPNPQERFLGTGVFDRRSRVVQMPAKVQDDWSRVFDSIRYRVGKHESGRDLRKRSVERVCSQRRKAVTAHEKMLPDCLGKNDLGLLEHMFSKTGKDSGNHESAFLFVATDPRFKDALQTFKGQDKYENLFQFLLGLKYEKTNAINGEFLKEGGVSPEDLFLADRERAPGLFEQKFGDKSWGTLSERDKGLLLDCYVRQCTARMYGIETAAWTPRSEFDVLMRMIDEKGPLAVSGCFGKPYYFDEPKKIEGKLLEGRAVYGWSKGDLRVSTRIAPHSILLVGAEMGKKGGVVYFIDPLDESDPRYPEKQRVYCMSYRSLCSHCVDLRGFSEKEMGGLSPFGFAQYGPLPKLPSRVVRLPELGKPNPLARYPGVGVEDIRGRVRQKGQDNGTCWYYTLNYLRRRVGKDPAAQGLEERRLEKIVSKGRKALSRHGDGLKEHLEYIENNKEFFLSIYTGNVESFRHHEMLQKNHWQMMLTAFSGQREYLIFYEYLKAVPRENELNLYLQILKDLGRDPVKMFDEQKVIRRPLGSIFSKPVTWESQSLIDKLKAANFFVIQAAAEAYGLRISSWAPHQPFDELIREITAHGSLTLSGFHGPTCYFTSPVKIGKEIEGRAVYGWRPGAPRKKTLGHMILVVGAEKVARQQLVYLIDPNHASDPQAPEKQRLYCISYRNLCQNAADLSGYLYEQNSKHHSRFGYAYTGVN